MGRGAQYPGCRQTWSRHRGSSRAQLTNPKETDVREDISSGYGLLRRPVYIQKVPHTLIALAPLS